MKGKPKQFIPGALQHTYKITNDAGILFYRLGDRLMMFTIQSVMARKHRIKVAGLCYMFTHIHETLFAVDKAQMDAFERDCISIYSLEHNQDTGRVGPLFQSPFGWAPKVSMKEQKSSSVYLLNNPPEKKLCQNAIEDRWNFLAYFNNPCPFSAKLVKHYASFYLREACSIVDHEFMAGRYLKASRIRAMFAKLKSREEREQLIDYIITKYMFIDFEATNHLFGSYENLVIATQSMTGAEFDIGETFERTSDAPYRTLISLADKDQLLGSDMRIYHLTDIERNRYICKYRNLSSATDKHLMSFFHTNRLF